MQARIAGFGAATVCGGDHMIPPFPFIVGCGRSGSTLLRAMLDAHPDMVVPGESYFLEQLLRRRDRFVRDGVFRLDELVRELQADSRFRTWEVDTHCVLTDLVSSCPTDLADAIRAIYASVARDRGMVRVADKTPAYALSARELAEVLPEAVFVHMVRDPRDVAASYRDASWGPRTLVSAARMWCARAGAARSTGDELGPARYLEVSYESLVADPDTELRQVCKFIGLAFDARMLEHQRSDAARSTSTRDGGAHAALLQPIRTVNRDWRNELSGAEAARVGRVVGGLAFEFGYESSPSLELRHRPRLWIEQVFATAEAASLRFRRTRFANKLRGTWRVLRRRSTFIQILASEA